VVICGYMNEKNNLFKNDRKSSEWDEGIFYILIGIIVIIPVAFFPYSIPKFAPLKELSFQLLVLLGLTMWKLKMISTDSIGWRTNSLDIPVFLFLLLGCLSLVWTTNIYNSILAIPLFIVGPILFFIIINSIQEQKIIDTLLLTIIIVGLAMSIYGILQYMGIDFEFWEGNVGRQRVMGLFGNVNYYAEYLILPLSLTIGLVLARNTIFNRLLLVIAFIVMASALLLTFTRGSYLAIAITIPVILFLYFKSSANKQNKIFYKKIILYFILLAIIALAIIYIPHPLNREDTTLGKLRSRVTIESLTSGSSVLRRLATWNFTWIMIEDYPILGSGIGTYGYHSLKYQADFFAQGDNREIYPHGFAVQAHNEYLQLWSELGIIGLLIFLWIIFSYYRNIFINFQKMEERKKAIVIGLAGGVTAVLVDSIFGFPLQLAASLSLFWMFLGLTNAQINIANTREKMLISHEKDGNNVKTEVFVEKQKNNESTMATIKKIILCLLVIALMLVSISFIIRPFMARVYWYYGNQQRFSGNSNKAINIYEKALKWNPWQGDIYIDLANSLRMTNNTQEALKNLHRAEIFTDHPFLPGNIAYLYNDKGESEKAIPYLEKAIKYQPDRESMLPLQLHLGSIYLERKEYKNAERHFADAIKNDSNNAEAYYGLAKAYRNQDKKEQAIEALEKVIGLAPESKLAVSAKAMLMKIGTEE